MMKMLCPITAMMKLTVRDMKLNVFDLVFYKLNLLIGSLDLTRLYPLARRLISIRKHKQARDMSVSHNVSWDGGTVPVRFYPSRKSSKIIFYIHGGGWCTESLDTYDSLCGRLSRDVGCNVLSVGYSLAPEHKFPTALEQCCGVFKEALAQAKNLGADSSDIILCGDSAGGNLSAALALMLCDRDNIHVSKQVLLYPVTACDYSDSSPYPSVREKAAGYTLTTRHMRDYVSLYMRSPEDLNDPYFAPINGDLSGMPETLVITAENDPLRDEGRAYAAKLKKCGVKAECYIIKGASHGFFADVNSCRAAKVRQMIKDFIR